MSDWHINPDEPTVLDYNTNFKSANHVKTLYDPARTGRPTTIL